MENDAKFSSEMWNDVDDPIQRVSRNFVEMKSAQFHVGLHTKTNPKSENSTKQKRVGKKCFWKRFHPKLFHICRGKLLL